MAVVAAPVRTSRQVRTDAAVLGVAALLVRLPAFFAARELHPDDGFYGASVVAMRGGGVPYRDVFSSQGPLHLPLLYLGDLLGLRTFNAPRVTPVVAGVVATVVTYLIGRHITSRYGALVAAVAVGASGSVLWVTSGITSDGPTLAFVLAAFLAALRYREAPSVGRIVAVALLLDGAILIKPAMGVIGGLASVVLVVSMRRGRELLIGAATAAGAALVVAAPFGLTRVWDQTVRYQLSSEREQSIVRNAGKVISTLWDRDVLLLALLAITVVALALRAVPERDGDGDGDRRRADGMVVRALWLWAAVVLVFLVIEPALWRNHMASAVAPLALLVALRPPPLRWLAVAAIVVIPFQLWQLRDFVRPEPIAGPTLEAHDALRALPPGAWAISDDVGIVWRAHRRTTDDFVDTSIKRQQQGQIDAAAIAREASNRHVCAVLVWTQRRWGSFADLPDALAAVGYEPVQQFVGEHGARVLYERATCNPPS